MEQDGFIKILVAEDNDISRELMVSILKSQNFAVDAVPDGSAAIKAVQGSSYDLAIVDLNMLPQTGFDFMKYLLSQGIKLPVIVTTADDSSDLLIQASTYGVRRVMQKPVDPARLLETVRRLLKRRGLNPAPMGVGTHETHLSPEDLMNHAIDLAQKNAASGRGGPFGALIADEKGKILGEGTNGLASRFDPTAHAEVMAIRQASEKLGSADLRGCTLYCSSEPTAIGKALIASVGIPKVYYGLSHKDVQELRAREEPFQEKTPEPEYAQLGHDKAAAMIAAWKKSWPNRAH